MPSDNYIRYTCEGCSSLFESVRKKRFCTKQCRLRSTTRKKSPMTREEYRAKVRESSKSRFNCEHCGTEAHRKLSSTNAKKGSGNRFCSMTCRCAFAAASIARKERLSSEAAALIRIARYVERTSIFRFACIHCGEQIVVHRNGGLHQQVCETCRKEGARRSRKIHKIKRRALQRGVDADSIDPIRVFERDKWKCHICGIKTLKSLRGTYEDRAPELEHIVPLSQGGSHTWGNVACSCRKCNGEKGATAFGQLGLDVAA